MPVSGYTYNKNLVKISAGSTDNWDVWYNQAMDQLDEPSMHYKITAAGDLAAGEVAAALDDGTGAKKAYLAASGTYTFGDPLGIAVESVTAGNPVRLAMAGRVQNAGWAFGAADKFAYLSVSGTVTTTDTGNAIGFVLSSTSIYFLPGSSSVPGGQTDTVAGANGLVNTGGNVDAVLSPVYGAAANTVCEGDDTRLHAQNTDGGTSAASFEINYAANSARLLTTGLTANRDYTFPDATTKLMGEGAPAAITADHDYSGGALRLPSSSGAPSSANDEGDVVFDTVNDDLYVGLGSTNWKKINQAGGASPGENAVINGDFSIWQRGTSFTGPTSEYTADRFRVSETTDGAVDVLRSTDVPTQAESGHASSYSLHVDVTAADAAIGSAQSAEVTYAMEGYDYAALKGNEATLSFWVKSSKTGTFCVAFRNNGKNRSYVAEYAVAAADTWEQKSVTLTFDQIGGTENLENGAGLFISWALAAGANYQAAAGAWQTGDYIATSNQVNALDSAANDFKLSQIKFERGSASTPFRAAGANIGGELAMAHRYYWRWNPKSGQVLYQFYAGAASAQYRWPLVFPTEMRGTPTVTVSGTWASVNVTSWGVVGAATTEQGCVVNIQSTSSGSTYVYPNSTDDNIEADAEL